MYKSIICKEIKKTILDKKFIILILIVLLFQFSAFLSGYNSWKTEVKEIDTYNNMADQMTGEINWEFIDMNIIQDIKNNDIYPTYLLDGSIEDIFRFHYHLAAFRNFSWQEHKTDVEIKSLKDEMLINSSSITHAQILDSIIEPGYANNKMINSFNQNILGIISAFIISLLVILLIAPLFEKEKKCNMDTIIFTTFIGERKNRCCKIIAVYIIIVGFILIYYLGFLALYLIFYQQFSSLNQPINTLGTLFFSPYNISILEYLINGLVLLLLGGITIVTLTSIIANLVKSSMWSLFISMLITFFPLIVPKFGLLARISILFPLFSMQGAFVFEQYIDYRIGGSFISYRMMSFVAIIAFNIFYWGIQMIRISKNKKEELYN